MSSIMKVIIMTASLLGAVSAQAELKDNCPSEIVNFWKNYAVKTDNYSGIPVFLIHNECFRARVSTDFHTAMEKRFDHPDEQKYIDQLYAQLDWNRIATVAVAH